MKNIYLPNGDLPVQPMSPGIEFILQAVEILTLDVPHYTRSPEVAEHKRRVKCRVLEPKALPGPKA